ncbi:MAG: hypothetical protein WC972_04685 [Trueperaceae bacterium]
MSVEVMSFRLTYRGKPAGTQVLKTEEQGRHAQLEGRSQFSGPLGNATVVQRSRSHAQHFFSLRYLEETQERNDNRAFDVTFDAQTGLVTAAKGSKDQASMPYVLPFRDPLGLLRELRNMDEPTEPAEVPMLGKNVSVQFAGTVELDTALGKKRARAYLLHPGQSVVYVDVEAPHYILKLTQRLAEGHVDALLVRVASEGPLEPFGAAGGQRRSRGGRGKGERSSKRRPRRRRRS